MTIVRRDSVHLLNAVMAELVELYDRARQAYLNTRYQSFFALHRLLDEFVATLREHIDFLAARAKTLGADIAEPRRDSAPAEKSDRFEERTSDTGRREWFRELAEAHTICGRRIHRAIRTASAADDFGTAYLLTGALRDLDKHIELFQTDLPTK